eukprot:TRINITY_DN776263_c0_g1_i1.p1 TRINITY_DN776263_c0_g1~~TRINITY_DN776263_c0_g1_i1.p1  ORF type:complete len:195 (-),score=43.99 TRINITY_DN776263_c0_g1_i1:264-848(-)
MNSKPTHYKIVLLGEESVGKSCLVVRFVRNEFFEFQEPTIGAAFSTQTVTLDNRVVKFEFWDTAGQERYRSLAPMYYRGAAAAVVVYDITKKKSFSCAKLWVKELREKGEASCVVALVGNKSDLSSERDVDPDEANEYALENDLIHIETSAKTDHNVKNLFVKIAQKLPKAEAQMDFPVRFPEVTSTKKKKCCG